MKTISDERNNAHPQARNYGNSTDLDATGNGSEVLKALPVLPV
jgi:hypothetical protein